MEISGCLCRVEEHTYTPCLCMATGSDGLCDGCRALKQMREPMPPEASGIMGKIKALF